MRLYFWRTITLLFLVVAVFCSCGEKKTEEPAENKKSTKDSIVGELPTFNHPLVDSLVVRLLPIDESNSDSSFVLFKNRLMNALIEKDVNFITSMLDDNIIVSFGGDDGKKDFLNYWELNSSNSEFWHEMRTCLDLGGTLDNYEEKMFVFPYIHSRWPAEFEAFEFGAAINPNVELKSKPDPASKTISVFHYDIVKLIEPSGEEWFEVKAQDGTIGYVKENEVRSPLDYRSGFVKMNGEWKMVFFVEGD